MEPLRANDPRQVGPYRLQGRLGGGGMGQVFLGRSRGGRTVAVKVVRPELADDTEFRRRFATEVEAAQRVGRFYTAQVVDADTDADPPWMATAYIPGPSLHDAVTTHGPLPPAAIGVLGAGLAEGLAAIHDRKLVHRDLKPGNVILAADGPQVIDFGIARALDSTSRTAKGVLIGTPAFMSPEQACGDEVGPASDVFALGAVLVFAATGRGPFGDGHHHAIMNRILQDDPDLTGLKPDLADLVGACLSRTPENRPGLNDLLDRLAVSARDATRWLPPQVTEMVTQLETTALKQRPETNGAFEMSWTGKEPLSTYADRAARRGWKAMAILASVSALVALVCLPLASGRQLQAQEMTPGLALLLVGVLAAIMAVCWAVPAAGRAWGERLRENRTGWALHVGPDYLQTVSATGRREFTWDRLQHVTIEEIHPAHGNVEEFMGSAAYLYVGVHIRPRNEDELIVSLPAGWPYPWLGTVANREDGLFPICVLGPMSEEQRARLIQALARYGGQKWQPAAT
ncbi:serine/threonine-protein kinase [Spirillospora sp. CA-108201]